MMHPEPIILTREEHVDEIMKHWNLLWPLPYAERVKRLADISDDIAYEATLRSVQEAMLEEPYNTPTRSSGTICAGLIFFDLAAIFFAGYVMFQMLRPL